MQLKLDCLIGLAAMVLFAHAATIQLTVNYRESNVSLALKLVIPFMNTQKMMCLKKCVLPVDL